MPFPLLSACPRASLPCICHDSDRWLLFQVCDETLVCQESHDMITWQQHASGALPVLEPSLAGDESRSIWVIMHQQDWWLFVAVAQDILVFRSEDLVVWQAVSDQPALSATGHPYRKGIKDPYVFYDQKAKCYRMFFSSWSGAGPERRAACIGTATSQNLKEWQLEEPAVGPHSPESSYVTPSCMQSGMRRWHMIYSDGEHALSYRLANRLSGPFRGSATNRLMTGAVGHCLSQGDRTLLIPTLRFGAKQQYLGVPRQIKSHLDGSLSQQPEAACLEVLKDSKPTNPLAEGARSDGEWKQQTPEIFHCRDDAYGRLTIPDLPTSYVLDGELLMEKQDTVLTLTIGCDQAMAGGVTISLSPRCQQITSSNGSCEQVTSMPLPVGKILSFTAVVWQACVEIFFGGQSSVSACVEEAFAGSNLVVEFANGRGKVGNLDLYEVADATES